MASCRSTPPPVWDGAVLPCIAAGLASAARSLHRHRHGLAPPLSCITTDIAGAPRIAVADFGCVRYHFSTLSGVEATVAGIAEGGNMQFGWTCVAVASDFEEGHLSL
ncbi:uncharacterized protein LOC119293544 [Triticum dicoccoides]|uniref:uncharacterized protein LOC119293544 n=1 Tax=Triticum dicoccoides TaxID=85692 RepID=UPI0018901183|nr:uncharacterized protein LOC119293544 [Triticum dicoccoides]